MRRRGAADHFQTLLVVFEGGDRHATWSLLHTSYILVLHSTSRDKAQNHKRGLCKKDKDKERGCPPPPALKSYTDPTSPDLSRSLDELDCNPDADSQERLSYAFRLAAVQKAGAVN